MRHLCLLLIVLLFAGCDLTAVKEICDETPSTQFLVSVRNVDHNAVGSALLSQPLNHQVDICIEHFPANTQAGHQYNAAVDEINRVLGSELHFTTKRSGVTHKSNFDLFPTTVSVFDYVDVSLPMPNQCSLPDDLTFSMRTCRHDRTGGLTDHFTIMPKSTTYTHFTDPSSSDYPQKHGILHELAHAFGMVHTGGWATADQQYISTMQGNLEYLSALDVSYLREQYPTSTANHRNYVASSLTRFNGTKGRFDLQNPDAFFLDANGRLKDCATGNNPNFSVAWFNTGNLDGEADICAVNRIFLREKSVDANEVDIKTWRIATMPNLSQDQWTGSVSVTIENPASIDFSRSWELVFKVNAWSTADENDKEDNEITKDISFFQSSCTP